MNSNIGINTDDIDPKMDARLGAHSAALAYLNSPGESIFALGHREMPDSENNWLSPHVTPEVVPLYEFGVDPKELAAAAGRMVNITAERRGANTLISARGAGVRRVSADATGLITVDFETDSVKLPNGSLSGQFAHQRPDFGGTPMPMSTAIQLIQQGALGRAFEETAERERRAKGVKKVAGPQGLIRWPSVIVRPGKPRGLKR